MGMLLDRRKSMLAMENHHHNLSNNSSFMGSVTKLALVVGVAAVTLLTGCNSMERKLGRGISNVMEPVRMGEFTRSTEQTYLAEGPSVAQSYGYVHGVTRTVQRTFAGAFDIVTFPIPTEPLIHPVEPVHPDSVVPEMAGNLGLGSDRYIGLEGGAFLPGIGGAYFTPLED